MLFLFKTAECYWRGSNYLVIGSFREAMKEKAIEHSQKPFSFCTAQTFYVKDTFLKIIFKYNFISK